MKTETEKPTVQDAVALYKFLEGLKWKYKEGDDDQWKQSCEAHNMSVSNLQIGIHNWIVKYTKEHFDYGN